MAHAKTSAGVMTIQVTALKAFAQTTQTASDVASIPRAMMAYQELA
jgi:hypothetical protein